MKLYRKPEGTIVLLSCEDVLTESLGEGDFGIAMPSNWTDMVRDLNNE